MSRINFLLLMAVLASGMVLVGSAYESRQLFTARDRARAEALRLEADYQRLQAERQIQATNYRVEQVARERLKMLPVSPGITFAPGEAAAASGVAR